jgi:hypothetical protein
MAVRTPLKTTTSRAMDFSCSVIGKQKKLESPARDAVAMR